MTVGTVSRARGRRPESGDGTVSGAPPLTSAGVRRDPRMSLRSLQWGIRWSVPVLLRP